MFYRSFRRFPFSRLRILAFTNSSHSNNPAGCRGFLRCFPANMASRIITATGRGRSREEDNMNRIKNFFWSLQIIKDTKGQDLIEYALMAGFVAVAAGAIMPGVSTNISQIFSKVASTMGSAASQGS